LAGAAQLLSLGGFALMTEKYFTVTEAKRILHAPKIEHTAATVIAAHSLMQVCEHDPTVTIDDMLRCLDYRGTIATVGARCLYVRTGRDGLGWTPGAPNGKTFVTERADWETYLHERNQKPAA
jgi:hypothetical protein